MTKGKILFHLSMLIFIGNTIILNTNLAFLPLTKKCPNLTTSLLIPSTIFLNHSKPSINISLMCILELNKLVEDLIVKNINPGTNNIKLMNKISRLCLLVFFCEMNYVLKKIL